MIIPTPQNGRIKVDRPSVERKRQEQIQFCLDSNVFNPYMCAIRGHSEGNKLDLALQDNVEIPYTWNEYTCHVGSSHDLHSVFQSGLIAGGARIRKIEDKRYSSQLWIP